MLGEMRAEHCGKVKRHEALVVHNNAGHQLGFAAVFTLKFKSLSALDGVEQQLLQVP
jgi:hypothetical protein